MKARYFRFGALAILLAGSLAMALVTASPAQSCTYPFHGEYPGTRVVVIGGLGYCGGYGVNCIESGCAGQGYCVQDGIVQRCYRDVP